MRIDPVRIALAIHPRWWRRRYRDEVATITADLLEEGRSRWRVATGLFFDALRQWARGPVPDLTRPPAVRRQVAAASAALPTALVVPLVLYTTSYQYSSNAILRSMYSLLPMPSWPNPHAFDGRVNKMVLVHGTFTQTATGPTIHGWMSWPTFLSGVGDFFVVVLALVCIIGLLTVYSSMVGALLARAGHVRFGRIMAWSPALAIAFIVGLYLWANYLNQQVAFHSVLVHGNPVSRMTVLHPLLDRVVSDLNVVLGYGTLVGSLVAMAFLASRVELNTDEARLPVALSRLIGHIAPFMTVAYAMWVMGLRFQGDATSKGQVIVSYAHSGWWPVTFACLTVTSALSLRALRAEPTRRQFKALSISRG